MFLPSSETPTPTSPLTVRLARGRHRSARRGACVMELSAMLAGEPFSDHPESVCPVLAAFLRAYNDHLGTSLRRRLYPWASDAVGTRIDDARLQARRARELTKLADELTAQRRSWWDRCLCSQPEASTAGVRLARAVKLRPRLHERVDAGLRSIYGIEWAPPMPPALPVPDEPVVLH